jgi:hypothetical protein
VKKKKRRKKRLNFFGEVEITTTTSTPATYNWHDTSMCVCVRETEVFTNKLTSLVQHEKVRSVSEVTKGKKAMSRGHKKAIEVKGRRTYVQKTDDGWMDG